MGKEKFGLCCVYIARGHNKPNLYIRIYSYTGIFIYNI